MAFNLLIFRTTDLYFLRFHEISRNLHFTVIIIVLPGHVMEDLNYPTQGMLQWYRIDYLSCTSPGKYVHRKFLHQGISWEFSTLLRRTGVKHLAGDGVHLTVSNQSSHTSWLHDITGNCWKADRPYKSIRVH